MDQTGSEESKQPAEESGASEPAGEHRPNGEHFEPEDAPESARRAFDLLERFSGELEEILQSLERAKGSATPADVTPPVPERAYRPSSIHFDSSPISTRIDPYALPPVESPGATTRPVPRLLLEVVFLIAVAAISARTGLRPLLLITAEAVAFLIVFSIELAIARENRRVQRLPAGAPAYAAPEEREARIAPSVTSLTLDQVEPLVWRADREESAAEADWPLVTYQLPSDTESAEKAPEGATEISVAKQPEAEVVQEPAAEAEPEADRESAVPALGGEPESLTEEEPEAAAEPEVEPESEPESPIEAVAEEREPERSRRFHLFRHEEKALEAETAAEVAAEVAPEVEPEDIPEVAAEVAEPELPRHFFHPFRHEQKAPEAESELEVTEEPEVEPEAKIDTEPEIAAALELETEARSFEAGTEASKAEPEAERENIPEVSATEVAPEEPRRVHLFRRHEKAFESTSEPGAADEPSAELETVAAAEPEIEANKPEPVAEESQPERPQRFHLLRHGTDEPEIEPEVTLESGAEIPASEAEAERHGLSHLFERAEKSSAGEPEGEPEQESAAEEHEPAPPRHFFHPFKHEKPLEATSETATGTEDEAEPEREAPPEPLAEESEPEQPRRFHLHRQEQSDEEAEAEPDADPESEARLESTVEIPVSEAGPERHGLFHLFEREAESSAEPETEPGVDLESIPEVFAIEAEPEQPRRFHLFRHEEKALDTEAEREVEPEPEPAIELEDRSESVAEEREPERSRRFHLRQREAGESETELDAETSPDASPGAAARQSPLDRPERVAETVEMTGEIDLPPEIAVAEIEHTLEDLGQREPGLRRRRWSLGAGVDKEVATQVLEDESADGESEVRFAAEQERRRREREYLRNLRVSR